MFTESSFYHQSYEIMKDLEPHMKDVTSNNIIILSDRFNYLLLLTTN